MFRQYVSVLVLLVAATVLVGCSSQTEGASRYRNIMERYEEDAPSRTQLELQKLSQEYPDDANVAMTQALVYAVNGEDTMVVKTLRPLFNKGKCGNDCRHYLADTYVRLGDTANAIAIYRFVPPYKLELMSTYEASYRDYFMFDINAAYLVEGTFWYQVDSLDKAYTVFKYLEGEMYDLNTTYNYIGNILLRYSRIDEACLYYDKSCRLYGGASCLNFATYCSDRRLKLD